MKRYLRVRGSSPGPLFIFADHTSISVSYFARQLAVCLTHCGHDTTMYTGHSFRIGAATTAAERGFTDVQIQTIGRWKSTAFRRYIVIPHDAFLRSLVSSYTGAEISFLLWASPPWHAQPVLKLIGSVL